MTATTSKPRPGLPGLLDRYLGPEATALDGLRVGIAGLGGLLLGLLTVPAPLPERLLLALLTAELCAGLMTALNHAGKAWIHRPDRRQQRLLLFMALQTIPLAIFIWLFRDQDLALLSSAVVMLAAGGAAVVLTPPAWQRAIGLVALLAGLFALEHFHPQAAAGAWFLPLLYARVFLAHLPSPRPD
ncbi:MAG: hypothetical protein JJU22_06485 [Gammaproteobacteria bacterium]|nr:hypothetical protein [Gammaproteobacteria bacterium]